MSTQARLEMVTATCASAAPLPILSYVHVTHAKENYGSRAVYYVIVDAHL
jgi:hypothetical protein